MIFSVLRMPGSAVMALALGRGIVFKVPGYCGGHALALFSCCSSYKYLPQHPPVHLCK